ncbi:MAG: hypothetical protein HYY03_00435 [Chloroflexi bacterium]|nr:hypothetical protein [Chloroflexota bacterium]
MAAKIIVMVADRDDERHGEITVLSDTRKAERLIETLLEAGFEQERIRIFSGGEMDVEVTQRPVVSLVKEPLEAQAADDPLAEEETEPEEEPASREAAKEKAPAAVLVPSGVRFSSLFRSA